jgi:hypothetical protein
MDWRKQRIKFQRLARRYGWIGTGLNLANWGWWLINAGISGGWFSGVMGVVVIVLGSLLFNGPAGWLFTIFLGLTAWVVAGIGKRMWAGETVPDILRGLNAPLPSRDPPSDHRAVSPLKFVDRHQEYGDFAGDIGNTIELQAVITNDSPQTIRDVEITLVHVRRLQRPGESVSGQPHIPQLPRRLVSDRNAEKDDLPPRRERAFRLCHQTSPQWPPDALPRLALAPGSSGGEIPIDFGRYLLRLIVSGFNTAPSDQTYLVDASPAQIYRRLCSPGDLADPKNIPIMQISSSVSRVLDHNDWTKWDKVDRFKLWEAACLWAGEAPAMPLSIKAFVMFRKLEKGIATKELHVIQDDLRDVIADAYERVFHGRVSKAHPYWGVKREELRGFALTLNEKPPFLFPRERT